ncbi:MAG: hypothetical protein COV52_09320 [Gammaproteobacteria bacterium CG11_big_fil_rev_8_21_14_0_20_46_22]|nr:MAG: hypothetical protein COW05_07060 [Gammaproteobacteria bacterium CG12_big_fil_rev_8_21_14_0_65_46_12]PIR10331.1 MAG: hypothetical protein COV52_09320 [Gammaproteobacteria bacterium CG11_big_fil_rev_8_21_14_0_20_46_22]
MGKSDAQILAALAERVKALPPVPKVTTDDESSPERVYISTASRASVAERMQYKAAVNSGKFSVVIELCRLNALPRLLPVQSPWTGELFSQKGVRVGSSESGTVYCQFDLGFLDPNDLTDDQITHLLNVAKAIGKGNSLLVQCDNDQYSANSLLALFQLYLGVAGIVRDQKPSTELKHKLDDFIQPCDKSLGDEKNSLFSLLLKLCESDGALSRNLVMITELIHEHLPCHSPSP